LEKAVPVIFCTIITESHLPMALALNHSLKLIDEDVQMYFLIIDAENISNNFLSEFPNTHIIFLKDIGSTGLGRSLCEKYQGQHDKLRWSLKSILILYLFNISRKVIYCDSDLYFYDSYNFLIDDLDGNNILLTPHWRVIRPEKNVGQFESLLWGGIFNAGFIAANVEGKEAITWWANLCLFKCEKDRANGYYDDQRYLDLMPLNFENVKAVTHRGCNVAGWNIEENIRSLDPLSGAILINKKFPIIFVHYSMNTIDEIQNGRDGLLRAHLETYNRTLSDYGVDLNRSKNDQGGEVNPPSLGKRGLNFVKRLIK
jgi:hypothetical protein